MNLRISGHHVELTPALRNYVATKLERILRHFDQVLDIKVVLSIEKQKKKLAEQQAECSIHVKGRDIFAESSHADLYAAIDDLADKLDRQVVRHKQVIQSYHHQKVSRRETLLIRDRRKTSAVILQFKCRRQTGVTSALIQDAMLTTPLSLMRA